MIRTDLYLRSVELLREHVADASAYPFSVPAIAKLPRLEFEPVTFFVGENGSGKSTLLEAIAAAAGFGREGGSRNILARSNAKGNFGSFSLLAPALRAAWQRKPDDGWYLRAESFFNIATHLDDLAREDFRALSAYGGESLHEMSHGESFLTLMRERFRAGLFLLDEPEAALSPQRQLAMLSLMHEMLRAKRKPTQFVIATHSPILLSYPGALILAFDGDGVHPIAYDDVPAVTLTRSFLTRPALFLRRLMDETGSEPGTIDP